MKLGVASVTGTGSGSACIVEKLEPSSDRLVGDGKRTPEGARGETELTLAAEDPAPDDPDGTPVAATRSHDGSTSLPGGTR